MSKRIIFILFIVLGFTCTGFGQVIIPPAIQCVDNSSANSAITVTWTDPPANPCGAFIDYTLFALHVGPSGTFDTIIHITPATATTYTMTNQFSATGVWYFYMQANYPCAGATVLSSDTVDNLNPATPAIVNVTVTPSGNAILNWDPSTSPQTYAYILYYFFTSNGHAQPIDTVYGRLNTTATDPNPVAAKGSYYYTVAALDSCGHISAFNVKAHNTIFTTASITACQRQINISWNGYSNWPDGVRQYQLWMSKNTGPYLFVGATDTSNLSYSYTDFNDGDSIDLFIRAISAADTTVVSNSNLIAMVAKIVQPPSYIYITNLTVDLSNHVDITWTVDSIAQLLLHKISRGSDTLNLASIAQFPVAKPLHSFNMYIDSDYIAPQNNPYFYKISEIDSCQTEYPSVYGETVNLQGQLYDYYVAQLTWNPFVLYDATVIRYNLYRDIGLGAGYQLLKTFGPDSVTYFDNLQQFLDATKGDFCYRIEAVYYISLPPLSGYHDTLSSFSNVACVIQRPIIYIPNAFSPGSTVSQNSVFKPTIIFGNPQGYSLIIFNRWGGKIFESDDPAVGWDGNDHGKEAQLGGYAYLIQFNAEDGTAIERKGIVLLVK